MLRQAMIVTALGEPPIAGGGPLGIPQVSRYGSPGTMYGLHADAAPAPRNKLVAAPSVPTPSVSADPQAINNRRDLISFIIRLFTVACRGIPGESPEASTNAIP
jgi:hypothetical protein